MQASEQLDVHLSTPRRHHFLSHQMFLSVGFRKSTPPHNRQLMVYYVAGERAAGRAPGLFYASSALAAPLPEIMDVGVDKGRGWLAG